MATNTLPADARPANNLNADETPIDDATLDTMRNETEALIATARETLSPHMFDAFLRWGEAAIGSNIADPDEDASAERTSTACGKVKRIGGIDAQNTDDLLFKAYLLALEAADCPATGPLRIDPKHRSGFVLENVVEGLAEDLPFFSPLCSMIEAWSDHAWVLSGNRAAFSAPIAAAMLEPFRQALFEPLPAVPTGYSPYMRAPLIQWQKAYAKYEEASADLAAFDRDVHTPAERKWASAAKRISTEDTDPDMQSALDEARAEMDVAQDRYDELVSLRGDTIDALLSLTAPSPSELATKLRLYSEAYGWALCNDPSIGDRITTDARRFGQLGAHLQTDQALLTAYADRRRVFEAEHSDETATGDDDVYFARIDASEAIMQENRATTIEGVLAKLRVAFLHQVGESWSDLAASDPSQQVFIDGLRMGDVYSRLAWSAIEDLARIGGVRLSEQGR